jgi:hypothetical protein
MREKLTKKDWESIQQPLSKDGYTNPDFDRLYSHKTKNPFKETERDRSKRKPQILGGFGDGSNKCSLCGKGYEYILKTKMTLKGGKDCISCNHDEKGFKYEKLGDEYFKKVN